MIQLESTQKYSGLYRNDWARNKSEWNKLVSDLLWNEKILYWSKVFAHLLWEENLLGPGT